MLGAIAAAASVTVMIPMDTIKTRLVIQVISDTAVWSIYDVMTNLNMLISVYALNGESLLDWIGLDCSHSLSRHHRPLKTQNITLYTQPSALKESHSNKNTLITSLLYDCVCSNRIRWPAVQELIPECVTVFTVYCERKVPVRFTGPSRPD